MSEATLGSSCPLADIKKAPDLAGSHGASGVSLGYRVTVDPSTVNSVSQQVNRSRQAGGERSPAGVSEAATSEPETAPPLCFERQAPVPCNTGVTKRTELELSGGGVSSSVKPTSLATGGVDTAEWAWYGSLESRAFERLRDTLNKCKEAARTGDVGGSVFESPEGDAVQVLAAGRTGGFQSSWRFQWRGCVFALRDSRTYDSNMPSVTVKLGASLLLTQGLWGAYEAALAFMQSLGYEHLCESVSRVDLAADLADQKMQAYQLAHAQQRTICRSRKNSAKNDGYDAETMYWGTGNGILLRVYDKPQQLRNKPDMLALMVAHRWGRPVDHCVRVEFQVRRKVLRRQFKVSDGETLRERLPWIAEWLTHSWFRVDKKFDRKNRHYKQGHESKLWREVQDAMKAWTGEGYSVVPDPPSIRADPDQIDAQALGCLVTAAALRGVDPFDCVAVDQFLPGAFRQQREQFVEKLQVKLKLLECQGRYPVVDDRQIPF